jgi:hypothetical protein
MVTAGALRRTWGVKPIMLLAFLVAAGRADAAPVVLELFTSQGCSSCPRADELLPELAAQPGVIALAFHVDYWDDLGWKDAFSSPRWTARQQAYSETLGAGPYTPQLVVGGQTHVNGSDRTRALAAIAAAAVRPAELVTVSARRDGAALRVRYTAPKDRRVAVAVTESGLVTRVARGENEGRTLTNDFVVRALVEPAAASGELSVPLDPAWGHALRVVVVAEERKSLVVRGAAATDVAW